MQVGALAQPGRHVAGQGIGQRVFHLYPGCLVLLTHQVPDPLEAAAAVGQTALDTATLGSLPAGALLDIVGHGLGCAKQPTVTEYPGAQAHRVHRGAVADTLLKALAVLYGADILLGTARLHGGAGCEAPSLCGSRVST